MTIYKDVSPYLSSIQKITFQKDSCFLYSGKKTYYYQKKKENRENSFSYFEEIEFPYYLKRMNSSDDDFSLFLVEKNSFSILDILYILYEKSSVEVELTEEKVQSIYQELLISMDSLLQSYFFLQDRIEEMYYPEKSYYLLLLHMSDIYRLLSLGRFFLEQWKIHQPNICREVFTLQNLSSDNFIMGNVLDASKGKRDFFVYELSCYYHKSEGSS